MNVDGRCVNKQNRPLLPPSQVGSLCSDLCSAHCRLSKGSSCISPGRLSTKVQHLCVLSAERRARSAVVSPVQCMFSLTRHNSAPCWFFPFKNYTFAKETTPLPLHRNKKHYKRPKKYCRLRPLSHRESGPRAARGPLVKLYQIENKCGAVQSGPCREPWVASINLSPSNKKHTKSI